MRSWHDELENYVDDRSTGYVIETLGEDVDRAYKRVSKNFDNPDSDGAEYDESDARDLYRAVFAYIEGLSFSVKVSSAAKLVEKGELDRAQFLVAAELTLDVRDGEIFEKPLRASLEESVKLACRLADMAHAKETPTLDTSRQWWSDFKKATGVRDRLTHPKLPRDVDISPEEVVLIIRVESGFRELMGGCVGGQDGPQTD